jgi:hypothetical protein
MPFIPTDEQKSSMTQPASILFDTADDTCEVFFADFKSDDHRHAFVVMQWDRDHMAHMTALVVDLGETVLSRVAACDLLGHDEVKLMEEKSQERMDNAMAGTYDDDWDDVRDV